LIPRAILAIAAPLAACGPPAGTALTDPLAWVEDRAADPAPEHAAVHPDGAAPCPPGAFEEELGGVEIDTGTCGYVVLSQPLLAPIRGRGRVDLLAWHNDLAALEPGEAHLLLTLDGAAILDAVVPIPSEADVWSETLDAPRAEAGAPVVIHLHNHGANTWNVNALVLAE
jgi:hypothetical protein